MDYDLYKSEFLKKIWENDELLPSLCMGRLELTEVKNKDSTISEKNKVKEILDYYKIYDEKSAKMRLKWLYEIGCRVKLHELKELKVDYELIKRSLYPLYADEKETIKIYSIIGYDIEKLTYLSRLCFEASYISEVEFTKIYRLSLLKVKDSFINWKEYFASACLGYCIFESGEKAYEMSTVSMDYLGLSTGLWQVFPLDKNIENGKNNSQKSNYEEYSVDEILENVVTYVVHDENENYVNHDTKSVEVISNDRKLDIKESKKKACFEIDELLREKYSEEFIEYLETISYLSKKQGLIGAIVDEFDPFTYEHKYLIEEALKQVDFLIIFVCDKNDEAVIHREDRFDILRKHVGDMKNIAVLTTGGFIF